MVDHVKGSQKGYSTIPINDTEVDSLIRTKIIGGPGNAINADTGTPVY